MIITRTAWCPHCNKLGRPHRNDLYITIGRTYEVEEIHLAKRGIRGFTPHIFEPLNQSGNEVTGFYFCTIHGCGVNVKNARRLRQAFIDQEVHNIPAQISWDYDVLRADTFTFTLKQWNALVMYTDDLYWLD